MEAALAAIGLSPTEAAFALAGVLVLVLAVRAARNAAIAIRARILAFATGIGLLGWGLKDPLHLGPMIEDALGPWLDEPHERVVAAVIAVVVLGVALFLFSLYVWIRTVIRLASFVLVGLALLALAAVAWLAAEGGLGTVIPPVMGIDGLVLVQVLGITLLAVGVLRALQPRAAPPKKA